MKKYLLFTALPILILFSCQKSNLNKDFCACADSPTSKTIDTTTLTIPNIFTPNGDGVNDFWVITNINRFPDCNIKIIREGLFNKTVFESTAYFNDWNGEGKSQKYKFEITIGTTKITGHVCALIGLYKNSVPSDYDCLQYLTPHDITDPFL